ncbi:alpha/beta hydrolase [Actinoplanes sp. TBRC 11911]|uniref:alpha/beta fold hydrolase n=1 Tax=Actinoplanes sp. TBRC 11911 TaxID=2729386 RepID=UPI00145F9CD1|nr:alpha/beta fold hydrolase [Actinoplanes sp. TBRC 11911]NMO53133.1 alpha/beta hydrolase [Actinoplanes sp. TBRC 11911]
MERIELADGRTVEYLVEGPPGGLPLVVHHGTPSGAVPFPPLVDAAVKHGMRVILHSRPGYGGSTPHPGRRVADVAADVNAILDEEGAAHFVTLGWSGGGPHALACAALLPARCLGVASVAGVAPFDAAGLDWMAGMDSDNVSEFGAAAQGVTELDKVLTAVAGDLAHVQPGHIVEAYGSLLSGVDVKVLTGGFADWLAASSRYSVSAGVAGWREDDLAFVADWGFALGTIRVPVAVWQGDQDRMVPFEHGRWLAAHVAGAEAHLLPGEGHLSLMSDPGAILDRLVAHAV